MTPANILLNDGWQFCLTPLGEEPAPGARWYDTELPHDWLIGDTSKLYEDGCGRYRRTLSVTAEQLKGRVFLNFDGVYFDSKVFVNGKPAGEWTYGYSAFEFDITEHLHEGDNELLVRVDHRSPNTRWYSGAGIYRDVTLKFRNNTYIENNGVYIHSERLPDGAWETEIETAVCGAPEKLRIMLEVFSSEGDVIAAFEQNADFGGGEESFLNSFKITEPRLWDISAPNLYYLRVTLYKGGELLDVCVEAFGYRSAEFSPEKGFLLNGRQLKLHGVCMHHDLGALGAAVNHSALYRQLRIMKEMGANAIRTSHNMPSSRLMQICDEIGLLVDCESFDMWENAKTEFDNHRFFNDTCERDVRSWVTRDRNHPSLIMWSIGNEISDTNSPHGVEIAQRLNDLVLKYDPKRNGRVTIGSNFMGSENARQCSDIFKLAGYNYAENFYNEHHAQHPDWTIYGSETSSAVRSRGVYHFPADTPLLTHDDLQCSSLDNSYVGWGCSTRRAWRLDRDCGFCAGQFVWTGFDYIGEPTPYSTKNSYFGIVDTAGFPKDIYYFYQSVWLDASEKPVLHIVPSYWDFTPGELIDVLIYSNAHHVELFLDGELIGSHEMRLDTDEDMRARFRVPFKAGELTAKGYDEDGKLIAEDCVKSCGDPVRVSLAADKESISADGRDIAFITISVTDVNGVEVGNARNRVRVEVSGAGRLVGLDNGDSTDYDSYKGDNRRLFGGKLLAMVQSTLESGEITVSVSSEGLDPAVLTIFSQPCEDAEGVSVVRENAFPAKTEEYTGEIPVRKIVPRCELTELTAESPASVIEVSLLPANATYSDISWKCVRDNGAEVPNAKISWEGLRAEVTAIGDGEFIARALVNNGAPQPQVCADVRFTVSGMGEALKNAYSFISASLLDSSNVSVSTVEDGAVSRFEGRTVMTFNSIDFGAAGTETLILHIGAQFDMPVEIWEGAPDSGRLIDRVTFNDNKCWCGFKRQEFALPERLRGVKDISIVIDANVIFGGFEFAAVNRAFDTNFTAENDSIYGDEYSITGRSVTGIGNNVIINFSALDFGEQGAGKLVIRGRTENPTDTVQLRYTPAGGEQKSVLLPFPHTEGESEQRYDIPGLTGIHDISFVFLPGTRFDFIWFRFE